MLRAKDKMVATRVSMTDDRVPHKDIIEREKKKKKKRILI